MPARLSCRSSSLKPNGSIKCSFVLVAAQSRAMFPVFGGISGSTRTMCMSEFAPWPADFGLIEDLPQYQAMRRCGHAGEPPVVAGQHILYGLGAELPLPHLRQRPHDAPAHLVKKSIAFQDESQQRPAALDLTPGQRPDRRCHRVVACSGKRFQVVPDLDRSRDV